MNGSACGLAGCVFFFAGRRTPTHCSFNFELGGGGGATLQTEKTFCLLFCRHRNKIQVKTRDGCSTDAARSSGHPCPRCIIFPFTAQRPPMPNASSSRPQQRSPMPIQRRGLRHDFQQLRPGRTKGLTTPPRTNTCKSDLFLEALPHLGPVSLGRSVPCNLLTMNRNRSAGFCTVSVLCKQDAAVRCNLLTMNRNRTETVQKPYRNRCCNLLTIQQKP